MISNIILPFLHCRVSGGRGYRLLFSTPPVLAQHASGTVTYLGIMHSAAAQEVKGSATTMLSDMPCMAQDLNLKISLGLDFGA